MLFLFYPPDAHVHIAFIHDQAWMIISVSMTRDLARGDVFSRGA
jgi:hypothetical protein